MDRRVGCLLLALAILVSGCVAPVSGGERPVRDADAPAAGFQADNAILDDQTTQYDPDTTVIAVAAPGDRVAPIGSVRRAVTALERTNSTDNGTYAVVPGASDPDIVVRVASAPMACSTGDYTRGDDRPDFYCVRPSEAPGGHDVVELSPGLTDEGYESAAAVALGRLAGTERPLARAGLPDPAFADPWPASDPVTVTIENDVDPDRDVESLTREAIAYWEANDERWGTYTADWKLVEESDADVTIAFVEEVESCGDHPSPGDLIGCAPVRTPDNLADGDERVRVVGGYDDETTLLILKHEIGHLYGVSHDEGPTDVMVDSISTSPR